MFGTYFSLFLLGWTVTCTADQLPLDEGLFWPSGWYLLVKARQGCPQSQQTTENSWKETPVFYQDPSSISPFFHTKNLDWEMYNGVVRIKHCVHEDRPSQIIMMGLQGNITRAPEILWPPGEYCMKRVAGQECPAGLTEGNVTVEGTVEIDGDKSIVNEETRRTGFTFQHCCQSSGKTHVEISLPTTSDFYLYPLDGAKCQKVKGMNVSMEAISWRPANGTFSVRSSGMFSYHDLYDRDRLLKTYLCFYHIPSDELSYEKLTVIVVSGSALLVLAVMLTLFIYWRRHNKSRSRSNSKASVLELEASSKANCYVQDGKILCNETMQTQVGPDMGCLIDFILDEDTKAQLRNMWINSEDINSTHKIGEGEYGAVWKGKYRSETTTQGVAIKSIKDTCSNVEIARILREAVVMGELSHRNVLNLIGVSVEPIMGLPQLVLPYMEHGDLHTYLRQIRYDREDKHHMPDCCELLSFGLHVARGMEYLSKEYIVHRDIACRNCMLGGDLVVCVADFGLARDVYESSYYKQTRDTKLPVKWMAPECLRDRLFTTRSDIWAYGVTLWEILTLACTPYPAVDNSQILVHLEGGGRLQQPDGCPDEIYSLMTICWADHADQRPGFSHIVETLERFIATRRGYLQLDELESEEIIVEQLTEQTSDDIDSGE